MAELFGMVMLVWSIGLIPLVVIEWWMIFTGQGGMCSLRPPPPPQYEEYFRKDNQEGNRP